VAVSGTAANEFTFPGMLQTSQFLVFWARLWLNIEDGMTMNLVFELSYSPKNVLQ
jgi:hypothetical protein